MMAATLGFLAAIKLFVGFFVLWFLFRKEYKLLIIFIVSSLCFTFLPIAFGYGIDMYMNYIHSIIVWQWVHRTAFSNWNVSLYSFFARVSHFYLRGSGRVVISIIHMLFYFILAGVLWVYLERIRHLDLERDFDSLFVLTTVTMFLVCPLSWAYYLVCLLLVVFVLGQRMIALKRPSAYWLALGGALFFISIYYPFLPKFLDGGVVFSLPYFIVGNLPMLGFFILSFLLYRMMVPSTVYGRSVTNTEALKFDIACAFVMALIPGVYTAIHLISVPISIWSS